MLYEYRQGLIIRRLVSILTRPYGRMLYGLGMSSAYGSMVSILTRPYGRMLCACIIGMAWDCAGFNPHPPLRADAITHVDLRPYLVYAFQSSPALTGGCYCLCLFEHRGGAQVSILTRPYGRMLLYIGVRGGACVSGFNPHPPLRADAMNAIVLRHCQLVLFQSSPALTGGCYNLYSLEHGVALEFQSSPALTGGCYRQGLQRPACPRMVSILTRPYGRMLFQHNAAEICRRKFQSSPALTGGCYSRNKTPRSVCLFLFQSSPALTGGCYLPSARPRHHRLCFNPHPPLRADAIISPLHYAGLRNCFNPHPPLRADAIANGGPNNAANAGFQSSPALTGGCYDRRAICCPAIGKRFNPHPPLRADAIGRHPATEPPRTFQSSPALTGGCYAKHRSADRGHARFQSSPALTGGCYGELVDYHQENVAFQSSPALTGGCYSANSAGRSPYGAFQSSPALTGGCYFNCSRIPVQIRCFNPHPPLRADAIPCVWLAS